MFLALAALTSPASAQNPTCTDKEIVFLGDSLFAGYGLNPGESYPDAISNIIRENGNEPTLTNAGVSGDTTTGGLARLEWSVGENVSGVVLELGANDALRGIPVSKTAENLQKIITTLQSRNISILLMGMRAPPNMGPKYGQEFDALYPQLAKELSVVLYPFFLDGVAGDPSLNQPDGIHPNVEGVSIIVERSKNTVIEFVENICS